MYILIDKDRMAVVHKHRDRVVLAKLAWIELPHAACVTIPLSEKNVLDDFSYIELRLLYKHTIGENPRGYASGLVDCVHSMLMRMPETDCIAFEVDRQAATIKDKERDRYQYVKGAMVPICHGDLFEPDCIKLQRDENEELMSLQHRTHTPRAPVVHRVAPHAPPARPAAPATHPRAAVLAPPKGGQRELIWAVADRMWSEKSHPMLKNAILALRKDIMDFLESQHGVKRNSSSNELGNWQKARIHNI